MLIILTMFLGSCFSESHAKLFRRPEKNEKTKVVASTPFSLSDDLKSEIDSFILINPHLIIATAGLERSDCPMRE